MKVKVIVNDDVIRDIGLGGLITFGQVLEVTNKCIDKLPNGMTYTYYEFSADVLGIYPTDGFRIEEDMVEVL